MREWEAGESACGDSVAGESLEEGWEAGMERSRGCMFFVESMARLGDTAAGTGWWRERKRGKSAGGLGGERRV